MCLTIGNLPKPGPQLYNFATYTTSRHICTRHGTRSHPRSAQMTRWYFGRRVRVPDEACSHVGAGRGCAGRSGSRQGEYGWVAAGRGRSGRALGTCRGRNGHGGHGRCAVESYTRGRRFGLVRRTERWGRGWVAGQVVGCYAPLGSRERAQAWDGCDHIGLRGRRGMFGATDQLVNDLCNL